MLKKEKEKTNLMNIFIKEYLRKEWFSKMDNVYEGEFLDINIIDENIIFSRIKIPIMESY